MKLYEIAVVLHPDLEIDLDRATNKVEKIIESVKGKVVKKDNWGKRKLAYKINKQDWGIYVFYNVQLDPSQITKIDAGLRISNEILRYLIVNLENIRYLKKTKGQDRTSKSKAKKSKNLEKQEVPADKEKK